MRKILVALFIFPFIVKGQVNSVSPFTLFGVGDLSEGYFAKNISMGGTYSALRDPLFINLANPASLSSLELTSLDFGVTHRFLRQTDQNSGNSINNQNTYFHYFAMGFKFKEWWGSAISLTPYSQIGYSVFTQEEHPDFGFTQYNFQGDGGINQIVWGNSFELWKSLSLGVNARYLFGTNRKRISAEFEDRTFLNSRRNEELRVSDVVFDFGLQYEIKLDRDAEDPKFYHKNLVIGATYGNNSQVNANQSLVDYTYGYDNSNIEVPVDTTNSVIGYKGSIMLPTKYSVGLSYGGLTKAKFGNSWMVTADFTQTNWSEYNNFEGEQGLKNSRKFSVGGYFIPRYSFKQSGRGSYFGEIEWRMGVFYEDSHIQVDNQPVTVQGFTAGFNLPFKPKNLIPGDQKLNNFSFGIVVGTKSSESNTLITEDFINLTFGLTFNDLWFQKRKYR
ncbi:MAG: hypothetical protein N4A46_13515 [Schleiferiaceae bacterium]|jgi:hypothetical protein|nr:hypothetical protein [Schleiferiaceae bacterium]